MSMGYAWLRRALVIHLMPQGNVGSMSIGTATYTNNYRTDKPIYYVRDEFKGIANAIDNSGYSNWIIFCYSAVPYYRKEAEFFKEILCKSLDLMPGPMSSKSISKFKSLVLLAAIQARIELNNEEEFINSKRLAELVGVQRKTWRAIWDCRWRLLVDEFKDYDEKIMKLISKSIDKEND